MLHYQKFVRWVTEREVLTSDVRIKIEALNSDPFPHTCSNTVQLPTIELDKENFLAMLEAVFDSEFNAI